MKLIDKLWMLWPSLEEMAKDLDESPVELRRLRKSGDIPDSRHDETIIARSLYCDSPLQRDDLNRLRKRRSRNSEIRRRQKVMKDFCAAAGGNATVSEKTGLTRNTINICIYRGYFSKVNKFEIMELARSVPFELPDHLFVPVK